MDDLLVESGEFAHGILAAGCYRKSFSLEEDVMKHTLDVANDTSQDFSRLAGDEKKGILPDETYYSACLLAKRLKVSGVAKVTPEMVLNLSRVDGRQLLVLSANLEKRRELFRSETEAAQEGHPGADEVGLSGGGDPPNEQGQDPQL